MKLLHRLLLILGVIVPAMPPLYGLAEDDPVFQLRQQVEQLKLAGPSGREDLITTYIYLGRHLAARKQWEEGRMAFRNALKMDPSNTAVHFDLAQMEAQVGGLGIARDRLALIVHYSSDANLRVQAGDWLNRIRAANPDLVMSAVPKFDFFTLYLQRVGNLSHLYTDAISRRLRESFGLKVVLLPDVIPPTDKLLKSRAQPWAQLVVDLTERYRADVGHRRFLQMYDRYGIDTHPTPFELPKMERFLEGLYSELPDGKRKWEELNKRVVDKYEAREICADLARRHADLLSKPTTLAVMGVTAEDIYTDPHDKLSAWVEASRTAVISHFRYSMLQPSQSIAIQRTARESLAAVGNLLGIERCTFPNCPRAHVNELVPEDKRDSELCPECKINLIMLYEETKPQVIEKQDNSDGNPPKLQIWKSGHG